MSAQTIEETEWKNHTSPHHKLSIQYPSNWDLSEGQETRFDEYEDLFISHFDPLTRTVNASFSVDNIESDEGPFARLESEKQTYLDTSDELIKYRVIEDIKPYPNKIDGEDAYSLLISMDFVELDSVNAFLSISTDHNGQGYHFGFMTNPAKIFDDPEIAEIRDRLINSIKWID